jgi:hypothetical protein
MASGQTTAKMWLLHRTVWRFSGIFRRFSGDFRRFRAVGGPLLKHTSPLGIVILAFSKLRSSDLQTFGRKKKLNHYPKFLHPSD